jgi:hypothetical protein
LDTGLLDYPKIIKQPMDLGTIQEKLKKGQYKTLYAVAQDVRLVWTNCMTYNADGSDFYKLADSLHKKWDDKYAKLLKDSSVGDAPAEAASKVTLADKRSFAKSLYGISKEDLGRVLVEVESKCPSAIVRNSAEDEVELNIDKIPPGLLTELSNFVQSVKGGKKKKAAPPAKKAKTG